MLCPDMPSSRLSSEATPSRSGGDVLTLRASSLAEVNSDEDSSSSSTGQGEKAKLIERTESLVSDVLSFYSMDGGDDRASAKVSFGGGLTSPLSFRSQSPSSGQYETAEDGGGLTSGGYASSPLSSASRCVKKDDRDLAACRACVANFSLLCRVIQLVLDLCRLTLI